MIFETHAHYDDEAFDEDRDELISSMRQNGIEYIVNVGSSLKSTAQSIELAKKIPVYLRRRRRASQRNRRIK